jgi:hypothetical protein
VKLTGRVKLRASWTRTKVILMVEYFFISLAYAHEGSGDLVAVTRWRDATLEDVKLLPDRVEVLKNV